MLEFQVVDLCFFNDDDDRLASVDTGGAVTLRDLDLYPGEDMNVINETLLAGKSKVPLVYVSFEAWDILFG